jgi:hypothetical protein
MLAALLETAFVEAGFDGYYRVYRSLDGAEQLNLGSQWIEF